ncbi:MAG: AMP-binding protein, partial [Anaerolineales bacterium]
MDQKPWLQNYDDGVPQTLDYPEIPLFHLLEESARKYPDSTCTIFKGARISYREMNAISDRLAAGLAEIGVKKGDRVGIYMLNSPQFIMAYFAVLKLGGVVVAINPLYSAREVSHQLNDAGIEAVIVLSNYYSTVKKVQPKTSIKKVIVTNIKETLPPILAFLFGLLKEKKEGFRVELAEGDYWMKELIETHKPEERPQVEVGPE